MMFDSLHDVATSNMSFFSLDMTSNSVVTVSPLNSTASVQYRTPLLQSKPILAIIYLIILLTVSCFGMVTNPISFIIHYKNQKLNKVGRIFLMNLCLADMCVNCVSMPACAIGIIKGEQFFRSRSTYCQFVSSLCFTACVCAILNLSMATINRYIFVCHNQMGGKMFNRRNSLSTIFLVWLVSFLLESGNIFGLYGHEYDYKQHACVWNRVASHAYTLYITLVLIMSPLFSVGVLNLLILRKIQKTKMDICKLSDTNQIRGKKSWLAETLRTSRTIFLLFMVFMFCWCPYVFVIACDPKDLLQEEVYLFVALLVHSHSSSGFLVYWIGSKEFVKAVKRLLNIPCLESKSKQRVKIYGISSNTTNRNFDNLVSLRLSKQTSRTSMTSNVNTSFDMNNKMHQQSASNLEEGFNRFYQPQIDDRES
ncbi:melatonin receptor type 1B-B [Octopus bimaculoides]|uniref:G-protein coupled receptors family 1 profile domain-containing protein n=1 Tax=Octopus bimaculoides TaxID=37653 RepID=A0A0L8GES7_OCTBM|nr:melatonin receptor type 1B-B [Octopus bimaculoides]|eukprot:XP_014781651.1 PREDICTED: melatonin receptor type 1B-B-like [Octopus bimaculoides]